MGSHDHEIDGEWTNHGVEEIEDLEDLEEISGEPGEEYDPPLEVRSGAYVAPDDGHRPSLEEATGIMELPDALPSEEDVVASEDESVLGHATEPPEAPVSYDSTSEQVAVGGSDPRLEAAIVEVLRAPQQSKLWDQVEQLSKGCDGAGEVAAAYRTALKGNLDRELALDLIDRAVQFHDEWLDDPEVVYLLLDRVLEIDPSARWAFDRISLKFTVEARWVELLALYDKVIGATKDQSARLLLLDEAAAVAKDCAGNPERAVDYLMEVFAIQPTDHQTGAALERLLKQQNRYRDLIDFWTTRLDVLTGQEALATRQQIATCWLENLNDPNGALAAVEPLLEDPRTAFTAGNLLEMILGSPISTSVVRNRALELLSGSYDGTKRWRQVVRALEAALLHVPEDERVDVHREIARRLVEHEAHEEALQHLAALVAMAPEVFTDALLTRVLSGKFSDTVFGFKLVLDKDRGRKLLHLAAERAGRVETCRERAVELYRKLIEDKPDDNKAIASLTKLYSGADRMEDLLALRQHELGLAQDVEKRLALRLQIATLLGSTNDATAAIAALRDNLTECPDHEPTLDALIERLEEQKLFEDLAELLTSQAAQVEKLDRTQLAAALWMRAARVSQAKLLDLEQAVDCYQRVVDLQPNIEALDELATVFIDRAQHAAAVEWLQKRLAITVEGQRTPTVVRLARAHVDAHQSQEALTCLTSALQEDPGSLELRDLLADLYRRDDAWSELVDVLLDGASLSTDDEVRQRYLLEAADVLQHGLRSPERAVPVLEEIVKLQPTDRAVRVALADALRMSGRLDDARALAETLIEEYGRRHPPARAALHLLLAQVLHAQGKAPGAVKQLEIGVTMDMGNLELQHLLGQVYRETGQLEKAERAYHALVLLLRRRSALARGPLKDEDVGIAEVLFELHLVAKELGAEERAAENLESAFDAAALDPAENERFERVLRASGDAEMLLRALDRRLASAEGPTERARVLADIASAQERLDQPDRALASLIRAIEEAPEVMELYDRAQTLAERTGELDDYAVMLDKAAERSLSDGNSELGCRLLMQLGKLEEEERRDMSRAAALYARAEETGCDLPRVWTARARVASMLDDESVELQMLRKLIDDTVGGPSAAHSPERTDALYRLSDLELANRDTLLAGVSTLARALEADPRYEHAARTLQSALILDPDSVPVVAALETVARAAADDALLLDALGRRADLPGVTQDILREAVEVAERLGNSDRVELLLQRAVEVARENAGGVRDALWAMTLLAALREAQGDMRDAVHWLNEASEVAEPEEARAMRLQVAQIAAGPLGDLEAAAGAYENMLRQEPGEPAVWQPLLDVLRRLRDKERLESTLKRTVLEVQDVGLRCELRIEHANLLRDFPDRRGEAIDLLRVVLEDDPNHAQAAEALADLFEEEGRTEDLVELLDRQLEASRERSDAMAGVEFALRLARVHGETNIEASLRTYRETLAWIPGDAQLMRGLLALLDPQADAAERANLIEGLLDMDGIDDSLLLALDLIEARDLQQDHDGLERALELAYRVDPRESRVLMYYQRLAEGLENEAKIMPPGDEAVGKLFRAAAIQADRLEDPASAAQLLALAQGMRPDDFDILHQLIQTLLQSGQPQVAVDRVSETLDAWAGDNEGRAKLHHMRADIWAASGEHDSAVHDLEQARLIEGDVVLPDLYEAVTRARESARDRSDFDAERGATLRLAKLLGEMSEPDRSREIIAQWVADTPEDMEAIRLLLEMDRGAGHWEAVAANAMRLVELESGPNRAQAALLHAEACDQLGQPNDARDSLELVFRDDQTNELIRGRLRTLYEQLGEYRELSNLLLIDSSHAADDGARFELLREAGRMRLSNFEQAASAIGPLSEALELQPNDLEVTLLLADAYISAGLIQETVQLLQTGIDRQGGRRSRELAALQHRMARAAATSDRNTEMQWLLAAFESYPQGTDVAAELADLATELAEYEVALKALRALATAKTQGTISRPMAFLKQAQIARIQGDDRKATFLAKKAVAMDPDFVEARDFLDQLGAS
jgi:tetratricopeptide (TPR) repeat protein